jgi:hypothetical protein
MACPLRPMMIPGDAVCIVTFILLVVRFISMRDIFAAASFCLI